MPLDNKPRTGGASGGATIEGPSTVSKMARITLTGNSYQRGGQYGKAFARHLEGFYAWFVKKRPADLLTTEYVRVLQQLEETTAKYFPQLLEEIKGWSDGAKLPYELCRIMAFHNHLKSIVRPGCSNLLVTSGPEGPWLARNCDLAEVERSWQIARTCLCDGCWSYTAVCYLGLPGGAGVNEAGLVTGGASMGAASPAVLERMPRLPYYLLATQDCVSKCCTVIEELGHVGKGIHLPLLDASGDAVAVELAGGRFHMRRPNELGILAATNHSPSGQFRMPSPAPDADPDKVAKECDRYLDLLDSSWARYSRLMEIACSAPLEARTPELGKRALADHQGRHTVCQHVPGGFHTTYSMVLSPGKEHSRAQLCWGYPCTGGFTGSDFP